jgi:hypothetical protein
MRSSLLLAFSLLLPLGIACTANTSGNPPPQGCPPGAPECRQGSHFDEAACQCVPDDNKQCPDPGICGDGMYWSTTECACLPVDVPPTCEGICPNGETLDPKTCACITTPPPPPSCTIPGYGTCKFGQPCVLGICPDGTSQTCSCLAKGGWACTTCDDFDAGPPPIYDAGPPIYDAGASCMLAGYGECPSQTSCVLGYCPDGVTPISCFCDDGNAYCTGACPPPYPIDAASH